MSLIFMDGMYYATDDIAYKYNISGSGTYISDETRRVGPNSIYMSNENAYGHNLAYNPPIPVENCVLGFAYRTTLKSMTFLTLGTANITIRINEDGSLTCQTPGDDFTTDPATITASTWCYFELKYTQSPTVASVVIRINGSVAGSVTNQNLTANTTYFNFYNAYGSAAPTYRFQDLYICDGLGATNNDFLGDVKVDVIRPDSAGTNTDFTPSTGANWENVDEVTSDGDATYNDSKEIGDKDTYNLSAMSITGQNIYGVQQCSIIRKTDASSKKAKQLILSNVTESEGSELSLNDTFTGYQRIIEQDPDTATTWTESGVNALESGLEVTL